MARLSKHGTELLRIELERDVTEIESSTDWRRTTRAYMSSKCDITFTALRHAHDVMCDALTICRTRPEHMAAFGW